MKNSIVYTFIALIIMVSCGKPETIESKKEELKAKTKELKDLQKVISELKKEIGKDTAVVEDVQSFTLVKTGKPKHGKFKQYLEIPGKADSRQNITVSSEASGMVTRIYKEEGRMVNKGEIIASIDAEILRNQVSELESRLSFATEIFNKQQRLWNQKIGSELDFLQAKNNKETLEKNIAILKAQMSKSSITAPISGYLDVVFLREGQMVSPGTPALRIVNLDKILIQADISEAYVNQIHAGDTALISFSSIEKQFTARIKTVGQVVSSDNRTFTIEIELDNRDHMIKPNVLADVKIATYESKRAITIPTSIIQEGKADYFVYTAVKGEKHMMAEKKLLTVGKSYNGQSEILSGLDQNDDVIVLGGRGLSAGEPIRVDNNK